MMGLASKMDDEIHLWKMLSTFSTYVRSKFYNLQKRNFINDGSRQQMLEINDEIHI